MEQNKKITAIYCRTAKQDPADLAYQRTGLQDYANAVPNGTPAFYEDYGYLATDPERPAFLQLEQDIRDGKVARVLAMSLSSLGRNTEEVLRWARTALEQGVEVVTMDMPASTLPERFAAWLAGGPEAGPFMFYEGGYHSTILRALKNEDFDYLYCQRNYHGSGIKRGGNFEYAGIYCKSDESVYDGQHDIRVLTENPESMIALGAERMRNDLEVEVRGAVEAAIGNNRDNLRVKELTAARDLENLDYFIKHCAASRAREMFLGGAEDWADYCCQYEPEHWTEESLLKYILDPAGYAASEAAAYIDSHQETILFDFLTNSAIAKEYVALAGNPRHPAQRIKGIMEAVNASEAKTVRVTIRKDGTEFAFKTNADDLRRDCGYSYGTWHIAAVDRREFERLFGSSASYGPEHIVRIEYARSVLYEAEVAA